MRNEPLNPTLQALREHMIQDVDRQLHDFQDSGLRAQSHADRKGRVSFARAISEMSTPHGLRSGPEAEFFQEVARARGESFDPHRTILPIGCLSRDLNVAQATAGGYLLGSNIHETSDLLRPWSIVLQGGAIVEEHLAGNILIPIESAGPSISWQSTETAQASPSTPTVRQAAMTPKVGIAIMNASKNFMVQTNAEPWLRRALKRTAGVAVDSAVLAGTGTDGQPLGLTNTPGLSTQSGTTLAWAGVLSMKANAALADSPDSSIAFVAPPATRQLLEGREKSATGTGNFIWADDRIASCRAYASTLMPTASMLCGPLSGVTVGLWGDLRIEINPFDQTLFKSGAIQIRVLVATDVAITVPLTAFTLATSIS